MSHLAAHLEVVSTSSLRLLLAGDSKATTFTRISRVLPKDTGGFRQVLFFVSKDDLN